MWLAATATGGAAPCPRFYLERLVARRWNVPPWAVDGAEAQDVEDEIRMLVLEGQAAAPA